MVLQFIVDLRLLNGRLPAVSSVFWPLSFQFLILHYLISVYKHFHLRSCYPHISFHILLHRLGLFHSVWHFPGHNSGSLTVTFFYGERLSACRPTPQPRESVHRIYKPRGRVTQLYPQAPGTHFVSLLRPAWAVVRLFFNPVTTRGRARIEHTQLKFQRSRIKTMLLISFDSQGAVHKEFVPEGKTVNAKFYKGVMDRLLKRI